jgi:uncharacterized protein (TIGR02266 family)
VVERERRAHPRKLVSTGVSFNDLEGATLRGWLHDISRGGCFVATPSLFTYGEELTIVMTLPFPRQRVAGKVRVVWIREKNDKDNPAGMGLEFLEVNEDGLAAIDKLPATAKLSRPKTVIGIAPPAVGSSPSYSDVKIPLPTPEQLAKPLPGLDAGATEPEGVPIVQLPEKEPEKEPAAAAAEPTENAAVETEPMVPPIFAPALGPKLETEPEPKKSGGREKLRGRGERRRARRARRRLHATQRLGARRRRGADRDGRGGRRSDRRGRRRDVVERRRRHASAAATADRRRGRRSRRTGRGPARRGSRRRKEETAEEDQKEVIAASFAMYGT